MKGWIIQSHIRRKQHDNAALKPALKPRLHVKYLILTQGEGRSYLKSLIPSISQTTEALAELADNKSNNIKLQLLLTDANAAK